MGNFRSASKPPTLRGKIGATIFLLVFLAFGVFFTCLIAADFLKALQQRSWDNTACVITRSTIVDNQKPSSPNYRLDVSFTYTANGHQHTGTLLRPGYNGSSDYYETQKLADQYAVGAQATCFIDPADPEHALLQRQSVTGGFFILLPLVFIFIGGGGIFFVWKPSSGAAVVSPRQRSTGGAVVLFSIFFLVGFLVLMLWFVPTLSKAVAARSWPQVPCTIVHSGVSSQTSNKGGSTYAVEVLYRYQFRGKRYASSRYEFVTGSSSGYDSKQDIVRSLPSHKHTVCYVNPEDPEYAVLNRDYSTALLIGLIPVLFMLIGAFGVVATLRKAVGVENGGVTSAARLARPPSRWNMLIAGAGIALFWNSIVAVFVNELINGWRHGHHDYFLMVFLMPFVLIGLVLIGNFVYRVATLFNAQ